MPVPQQRLKPRAALLVLLWPGWAGACQHPQAILRLPGSSKQAGWELVFPSKPRAGAPRFHLAPPDCRS